MKDKDIKAIAERIVRYACPITTLGSVRRQTTASIMAEHIEYILREELEGDVIGYVVDDFENQKEVWRDSSQLELERPVSQSLVERGRKHLNDLKIPKTVSTKAYKPTGSEHYITIKLDDLLAQFAQEVLEDIVNDESFIDVASNEVIEYINSKIKEQ